MTPESLIAAVRERLDETEQLARQSHADFKDVEWLGILGEFAGAGDGKRKTAAVPAPAAVLRRVEADREIVDAFERALAHVTSEFSSYVRGQDSGYCDAYGDAVRSLARGLGIDLEKP